MTAAETLRAYWAAMQSNDFAAAARYLAVDVTIDWPQSNERIVGRDDFIALNTAYPAQDAWRFTVLSVLEQGADVVTVTDITDGTLSARAITFSRVDPATGLIEAQTEYWPDTYEAPPWRAKWVRPLPPHLPSAMPSPTE